MISWSSSTASSAPATSLYVTLGVSGDIRLARLLPKLITFEPPPCIWFMRKIQKAISSRIGSRPVSSDHQAEEPIPFESKRTFCFCRTSWNANCDCAVG